LRAAISPDTFQMTSTDQRDPAGDAPRFQADRPRDLHRAPPPWHRLAYIVRALPRGLEQAASELPIPAHGRVLDYGCGDLPYRRFFGRDVEYVAADLPGNPLATTVISSDGTVGALADSSFDAVLSTQVLEHVSDPNVYLRECWRVLRPGGRLLLSTHGLMVYHPDPVDYWRWTSSGLKEAVSRTGFDVTHFEGIMGLAATGFQFIQDAWYYRLPAALRPLLALTLQTLAALADRFDSAANRRLNSMVFVVVAAKP
jgi:SAM-dependent methyltransferase